MENKIHYTSNGRNLCNNLPTGEWTINHKEVNCPSCSKKITARIKNLKFDSVCYKCQTNVLAGKK